MTKKKVLIIDDEAMVQRVITKLVEEQGAEAVLARSAEEVKKILESTDHFSLVILDLILPGASGWDLIDIIDKHSKIPIVIITGAVLSPDEKKKLLSRTCAIVEKDNFDINNFRTLLINMLKQ